MEHSKTKLKKGTLFQKTKNGIWYYRYQVNKVRKCISLKTSNFSDAKESAEKILDGLSEGLALNPKENNNNLLGIRISTVKLISKLIYPLTDSNLIPYTEYREITAQLNSLAKEGKSLPVITPKLLSQTQAAEMLNLKIGEFKMLVAEGAFPFNSITLGNNIKYKNTDIIQFIMSQ